MPTEALDLTNPADWLRVYDVSLSAMPVGGMPGRYYRIPDHSIPTIFDRYTLAIGASSTQTRPTWNLAFYAAMLVQIPGVGRAEAISVPVILGLKVIEFPVLSSQFTLKARLPRWHIEMDITIWKYIGT